MNLRRIFPFKPYLYVLVHSGLGSPYAVRLSVHSIYSFLTLFACLLLAFFLGTVLFFRELEISRGYEERLLALEIQKKLTKDFTLLEALPKEVAPPILKPKRRARATVAAPAPNEVARQATAQPVAKPVVAAMPDPAMEVREFASVRARISGLVLQCEVENCKVTVGMVPSSSGTAEGSLLLVLETEVRRIGPATHTTEVRKRYLLYPGFEGLDELDTSRLGTLKSKRFRFSNALQSTVTFQVDKTLKPVTVDAYVFDPANALISHRRKQLDL